MRPIVAFQGVHGANSELAIRQHFGDRADSLPTPKLGDLFDALQTGAATLGMLPVENALAGAVSQAYELLMESDLRIQAEVILHVHHALVAPQGVKLADLRYVRSHPQALAQCEQFLRRNGLESVPWHDTAGAAKDLADDKTPQTGALSSELAAELYGLDVLAKQAEDVPFNYTRFFVIGNDDPQPGECNKTSLVFATRNRPSALYDCLGEFATRGINVTKIESRPRRNRPWEPIFFLDIEGYWQETHIQEALARLLQRASFVKMLGSYPAVQKELVGI